MNRDLSYRFIFGKKNNDDDDNNNDGDVHPWTPMNSIGKIPSTTTDQQNTMAINNWKHKI